MTALHFHWFARSSNRTGATLTSWKLAALLSFAWIVGIEPWKACWEPGPSGARVFAKKDAPPPPRFRFTINPKTPVEDLLPVAPPSSEIIAPWMVKELEQVPQILFQKPQHGTKGSLQQFEGTIIDRGHEISPNELGDHAKRLADGMGRVAHNIAKINHVNKAGTDHFIKVLVKSRPDLAGLPFVMGEACRLNKKQGTQFIEEVALVRRSKEQVAKEYADEKVSNAPEVVAVRIAALMQMLAIEPAETRQKLVQYLSGLKHVDATRALTRLAIFSFDTKVRQAALGALKNRPAKESTEILLAGLRYPWPEMAQFAADAIVKLQRTDLLATIVDLLDEPDPRAPRLEVSATGKRIVVRELVRLNHHHNCLLCHAPGNSADIEIGRFGNTPDVLTAAVPIVGQPLPPPSQGYDPFSSPDIRIRADVTYLRQDFSLLQVVKDAAPWPESQRFDFLVRTREVSLKEVEAFDAWRRNQGADYISPYQRAIGSALRALTARNAGPAWRDAQAFPKR